MQIDGGLSLYLACAYLSTFEQTFDSANILFISHAPNDFLMTH
jgi:hypothetical protein